LLLHLALNASEAIGPEIGVIVIATGVKDCDAACLARTHADEPPSPGRYVFLRVADSGCGMDAATQARLFEPFFTTKRARHGRGLAGIRGIACEHRGTVAIESEEGRGSSFTVLFPALQQPAAPPTALPGGNDGREPQAAESPAWLGQRTILVIEDEEHIRSFLRTALMSLGFNVLLAADGNEGLRLFRERQRDIRLTLLDLTMPPPNGETTLREIRRIDPRAAVVLCSGQDPAGLPENIRGECFLPKPCQMSALEATVRVALATAAETGS
jgi:CheY-like chemotaxis protein